MIIIDAMYNSRKQKKDHDNRVSVLITCQNTAQSRPISKLLLNYALWNARSLNSKVGPLSMKLIEENTDVVLLTETWLKYQNDPVISDLYAAVSGYTRHHHSRTKN